MTGPCHGPDLRPAIACDLPDHAEQRRSLQPALGILGRRVAVVEQRGAHPDLGHAVLQPDRPKRQPGIHAAVERHAADGAAVPPAGRLLVVLDELHRPALGRAGHRNRPGMAEEAVQRVEAFPQRPLDMVHRMDQPRVKLDLPPADHPHRTGFANPRLVVAVHIGTHGQFGRILGRIQQRQNLRRIPDRIRAARDGAGNRAGLDPPPLDPDIHFRRRRDQKLALAKIDQRAIRRRIGPPQPAEQGGRPTRRPLGEHLTQDDLEQIAPLESIPRPLDRAGIVAGPMIIGRLALNLRIIGSRSRGPRQPMRPLARRREFVMMDRRRCPQMVHDQHLIRQIKHEIPLIVRRAPAAAGSPRTGTPDRSRTRRKAPASDHPAR